MAYVTVPSTAALSVYLNGSLVGALQTFSETCTQSVHPIGRLGRTETVALHAGRREYFITMSYLLPLGCSLVELPPQVQELTNFTLELRSSVRTLRFEGCQFKSVETSCQHDGSIVCKAQLYAISRQSITEEG